MSTEVEYLTSPNPMSMGLGSHPINVPLSPEMGRDPRLQLDNGRVSCTTCHSPYSSEKKLLVMSNTGSRLCLSCHSRI